MVRITSLVSLDDLLAAVRRTRSDQRSEKGHGTPVPLGLKPQSGSPTISFEFSRGPPVDPKGQFITSKQLPPFQ